MTSRVGKQLRFSNLYSSLPTVSPVGGVVGGGGGGGGAGVLTPTTGTN